MLPWLSHWHDHRNLQSSVLWVSPPHLALYTEQLGHFRNIHTTKPFSCRKPLILPIAPRGSAKAAPWPARQGTGCCLPTYLTSPLPSLWPLCKATVTPFVFPKRAKTAAATQASYLFSRSLEFSPSFQALCLAGSFPVFKAQLNCDHLESPFLTTLPQLLSAVPPAPFLSFSFSSKQVLV